MATTAPQTLKKILFKKIKARLAWNGNERDQFFYDKRREKREKSMYY